MQTQKSEFLRKTARTRLLNGQLICTMKWLHSPAAQSCKPTRGRGWQSSTANEARVSAHTGAAGTCDGGDLKGGTERGFSVLLLLQRFNGAARQCKQQFVCDGCDMLPKMQKRT